MPRQENTKEKILECAFELFKKPRFSDISLSEIAAKVGISKTAIFRHYKNKNELLETMRQRFFEALAEMFESFENIEKPYNQKGVQSVINCVFDFNEKRPNYLPYYLQTSFTDELLAEGVNLIMLDNGIRYFSEELFKDTSNFLPKNLVSSFFEQTILFFMWMGQKEKCSNLDVFDREAYKACLAKLIYSGLGKKKIPISPERKKELDQICKVEFANDEKSNRFLNAFVKLVQESGSSRITVEKIAEAVGMAKSSVYAFFANKRDYFVNMLCQETERANQIIKDRCMLAKNSDEALYIIMRTQANYFALRPQVIMLHGYFIFQEDTLSETELEFFRKKALGIFNEGTAKEILPSAFNFPVSENSILYLKWISELTVGYMLMGTKHKFAPGWLDFYVWSVFEMIECGIKAMQNNGE